jgi:hypothetical protein
VRYSFEDGTIAREKTRYGKNSRRVVLRTVLATEIKDLRLARSGGFVRVRGAVDIRDRCARTRERILKTRVWLRN